MKVGILGSGIVAKALAAGFLQHDYEIMFGTRVPDKKADWVKQYPKSRIDSVADTAKFSELAVLAVKGTAAEEVLRAG